MTSQQATIELQAAIRTLNAAIAKAQGQIGGSVSGASVVIETEAGTVTIDGKGHVIVDRSQREIFQDSQSVKKAAPAMWGKPVSDSSCPTCGRSF